MTPLTKPMPGIGFVVWVFYFHFNFAKTFFWAHDITSDDAIIRRTEIVAFCVIDKQGQKAFSLVVGPIKVMIGVLC